jgi:dihydrolipoamide dehydrogenase
MPMKSNPAAGVRDEAEGLVKAIYEEGSARLLGMQVLGAGAEDLIHVAAVALRCGLKRGDMAAMHYVFPTLAGAMFDVLA